MSVAGETATTSAEAEREQIHLKRRRFLGWITGVPLAIFLTLLVLGALGALVGGGQ